MKTTSAKHVIAAHENGFINLRTMTIGQVCRLGGFGKDSVSAARKELGIRIAPAAPHRDDGRNAELLRNWR